MAHHGGPETLPRAHRPRAPIMSVPVPTIAPLAPLRAPPPVTLTAPRPEAERAINEYVENPIGGRTGAAETSPLHHLHLHLQHQQQNRRGGHHQQQQQQRTPPATGTTTRVNRPPPPIPNGTGTTTISKQPTASSISSAITTPPTSTPHRTFIKDPPECTTRRSIMCSECGRCRCSDCQQPRRLPACWLCNNHCLCSADAVVDYASCLCCVKGVYYHFSDSDSGETSCADNPCGCGPERRTARWGCLAVLSVVLPCLWLYWPMQGCKRTVETCYSRYSRQGCRCRPPLNTPEKRLLDSTPDF